LKETFWDLNNPDWSKSNKYKYKYKCAITSTDDLTDEWKIICDGYPVKKGVKESPNINCGPPTKDTKLVYTIYDVLT